MERIRRLNRYQKGLLLFLAAMTLGFAALYFRTISRTGFLYKHTVLIPSTEGENTVYSGKILGQAARFTVAPDKTVRFQYGEKTYGPYTAVIDPSAVPKNPPEPMTGVELSLGDKVIFRGGVSEYWMYNEDGTVENIPISSWASNGFEVYADGTPIDPMEPSPSDLLDLIRGPAMTHKGTWIGWVTAAFLCVLDAAAILFADELFQWNLAFQIRNASRAEPSEWEIAGRYLRWSLLALMALVVFVWGLR